MLYWREAVWGRDSARQIWSANLLKTPYLKWLEGKNLQNPMRYVFEALVVSLIVQLWLLPLARRSIFTALSIFGVFLNGSESSSLLKALRRCSRFFSAMPEIGSVPVYQTDRDVKLAALSPANSPGRQLLGKHQAAALRGQNESGLIF